MIEEKCSIMSNKENEEVFLVKYLPDNKKVNEVVIAIHGFGSTKHSDTITMLAEKISEHGYAVFALDLPAHGESKTEILTIDKAINYLLDLEDYIKQEYKEAKIGYFASSFGSYLTLLRLNKLEKDEEIDKVVLRCSAIDMKNIFKDNLLDEGYEKFKKQGYADLGFARKVHCTEEFLSDLERNDIFKDYHSSHKILLIHGTEDECAPYKDALRFADENKNAELKTIVGAGHRFLNPGEIEKAIEIASNYYIEK